MEEEMWEILCWCLAVWALGGGAVSMCDRSGGGGGGVGGAGGAEPVSWWWGGEWGFQALTVPSLVARVTKEDGVRVRPSGDFAFAASFGVVA